MDEVVEQSVMPQKQINKSLNVIKCIAIFAIICIHCVFYIWGTYGKIIDGLARFAIPMFFLIFGFYSFYNDQDYAIEKYKTKIIKVIILIIISNALYIGYFILTNNPNFDVNSVFAVNSLINYVIYNVSPVAHLWILQALLYCYILFFIMSKLNIGHKILYYLIPLCLIANIFLGEYSQLCGNGIPIYYRCFFITGLPFFTLGYLVHEKQKIIDQKFSNKIIVLCIILILIFNIFEILKLNIVADLYVGTIFLSTVLFIWCIKNPETLNIKLLEWIGGNLYANMYILHVLVLYLCNPIFNFDYFQPIIIFIITAFLSYIIYLIVNAIKKSVEKEVKSMET